MKKILIGIAGPRRSGKDTFADHLIKHHAFVKLGFADPIRTMLDTLLPGARADRNAPAYPGASYCWRQAATALTDSLMALDEGIFFRPVIESAGLFTRVVIPDVRHEESARLIRAAGGVIVRLERPGLAFDPATDNHQTELPLSDELTDTVIVNKTLIDFLGDVENFYQTLKNV